MNLQRRASEQHPRDPGEKHKSCHIVAAIAIWPMPSGGDGKSAVKNWFHGFPPKN